MKFTDVFVFLSLLASSWANEQVDFKGSVYDIWEGCDDSYKDRNRLTFFRVNHQKSYMKRLWGGGIHTIRGVARGSGTPVPPLEIETGTNLLNLNIYSDFLLFLSIDKVTICPFYEISQILSCTLILFTIFFSRGFI